MGGFRCNDQAPEDVPKALKSSLDDLQIDHLDLYLVGSRNIYSLYSLEYKLQLNCLI